MIYYICFFVLYTEGSLKVHLIRLTYEGTEIAVVESTPSIHHNSNMAGIVLLDLRLNPFHTFAEDLGLLIY